MPDSCDAKNSPSFSAHTRTGGSRDAGKSPEIIADQLDIGLDRVNFGVHGPRKPVTEEVGEVV
jgi:hypothetical protein